jgi:hypothetical protein
LHRFDSITSSSPWRSRQSSPPTCCSGGCGRRRSGRASLLVRCTFRSVLFAPYFLALAATGGVSRPVELRANSIALAGVAGLPLSDLAFPPTVEPDPRGAERR